jgi:hypothetical protein
MNVLLQCDGDKALLLHIVSSSGKKDLLAACRRVTFEKNLCWSPRLLIEMLKTTNVRERER